MSQPSTPRCLYWRRPFCALPPCGTCELCRETVHIRQHARRLEALLARAGDATTADGCDYLLPEPLRDEIRTVVARRVAHGPILPTPILDDWRVAPSWRWWCIFVGVPIVALAIGMTLALLHRPCPFDPLELPAAPHDTVTGTI